MTSYDDDQVIDFKKLEKDVNSAAEADAKYWRENDAKFRAVNQKVASYEEFKDIVKASHLKPLEKDDRLTNIKFIQPWNAQARQPKPDTDQDIVKASHLKPLEKDDRLTDIKFIQPWNSQARQPGPDTDRPSDSPACHTQVKSLPANSQEFVRDWRKLGKVTESQCNFLLDIGAEQLGKIFKPEIGFGLLGEFARCWNECFNEDSIGDFMAMLDALSKTNRFALTVQFLSSKEKQDLKDFFEKIRFCLETACNTDEDFDKTKLDWLGELEKLYEIKK